MNDDKDNIIQFPTNKIVRHNTTPLTEHQKVQNKLNEQLKKVQTKQYIEHQVDDIVMNLINSFLDMAIKTDKITFTKDLAMLVDTMRGLIYRDFNMKHPSQVLSEKMVELKVNRDGGQSARINYDIFHKGKSTRPLSKGIKEELKDGPGIFEPDGDLDK